MPVKRRASKQLTHRITPEAVEAFSKAEYGRLHSLLNLRPWCYSPLPSSVTPLGVDDEDCPFDRDALPVRDSWYVAQDLQTLLIEACRQRGLPLAQPGDDH